MAKAVIQSNIFTTNSGVSVAGGASVEIRDSVSGALVQLWSDRAGTTTITNPVTADSNGFFRVYATPARLNIKATSGAFIQELKDVEVFNSNENNDDINSNISDIDANISDINSNISDIRNITKPITLNDVDTDHDIKIKAGSVLDSTGTKYIKLDSDIIKQIDANWSEGTNSGGFPSGLTLSADTTYHLFFIEKSDGTVDAGWDTDLDAVNLLSDATGYTHYGRIFSNITDSSSNIVQYVQSGDYVYWTDTVLDYSSASTGTSKVVVSTRCPTGISVNALVNCEMLNSDYESVNAWFNTVDFVDAAATGTNRTHAVNGYGASAQQQMNILTDNLGRIAFRASLSSASNVINVRTAGYIDCLGK